MVVLKIYSKNSAFNYCLIYKNRVRISFSSIHQHSSKSMQKFSFSLFVRKMPIDRKTSVITDIRGMFQAWAESPAEYSVFGKFTIRCIFSI